MTNCVVDLNAFDAGAVCFPLYWYDMPAEKSNDLLSGSITDLSMKRDAISDRSLIYFSDAYPGINITKEDLFYYVYGILHSTDFLEGYADSLNKETPRIPRVKAAADFWAFSKAGQALADLHLNYESARM